ncbi:hypothetical protein HMSSN036_23200 [Paenibacillus macerans]|nr:hypothetical protein HMSSN036_23200 [Paenibacillus macerans]
MGYSLLSLGSKNPPHFADGGLFMMHAEDSIQYVKDVAIVRVIRDPMSLTYIHSEVTLMISLSCVVPSLPKA